MMVGLKLWSTNVPLLDAASKMIAPELFQYVELMPVPGTEVEPWKELDIPYVLHAPTEKFGFNIGDAGRLRENMKIMDMCIKWADELNAAHIIIHPGYGKMASASDFLERVDDPRILVENMPKVGIGGEDMVGYLAVQLRDLMGTGAGLCLDMNHAMKASISLGRDWLSYIQELDALGPAMYHLADGHLDVEKDEHLHLGQGDYDLAGLMAIAGGKPITLETPRETLDDDLRNLERLRSLL